MIEALGSSLLLGYLSPVALFTAAICLLVLRAGASRVFFDIVGTFQAAKMLDDAKSAATVFESLYLDAVTGIQESAMELAEVFNNVTDTVVPIARELAEAEIQLEKFLDTSENIADVRNEIEDIGINFAFAGDQAMQAAAKMAQISGVLGPGSLATGTQIGMEFGLISGMETEAAMQRMINLQQQTQFMTEGIAENATEQERATQIRQNAMRVLDQLNTIENRSAATMEQITFVMNQFASQAHLANEEIRTMAAMSAVMIETGEEQGKGGRALRMMFARLGSDIGGAATELENLGIAVTDANGDMRGLSDILKELEPQFLEMDGARKQEVAQIIAGNRHYTRFLKIMNNLDRVKALELEATLAMFPAMEEIERRRDTELFQLEQAEAKVRNLSASLGDALLPAMVETTQKQAMMIEGFLEFTRIPVLGDAVLSMFSLGKAMSVLIAPLVATVINFASLSISMQTHQAILRALNDPTQQRNKLLATQNKLTREQKFEFLALDRLQKDNINTQQMLNVIEEQGVQALTEQINVLFRENMQLESVNQTLDKNSEAYRKNEAMIKTNKTAMREIFAERKNLQDAIEADTSQDESIRLAGKQAQEFNNLSMGLMGAGSAMMLFSKNQSIVTAGMALNTAAMGVQVFKMIDLKGMKESLIAASKAHQAAMVSEAATMSTLGMVVDGLKIKTRALMATMAPLLALGAGFVLIHKALKDFGIIGEEAEEEAVAVNDAMVDMGEVADMIGEVNNGTLNLNESLEMQRQKVESLRKSNSGMLSEVLAAEEGRLANLQRTNDILSAQAAMEGVDQGALSDFFDALEREDELLDKYGDPKKLNPLDITYQQHFRRMKDGMLDVSMSFVHANADQQVFAKNFPEVFEFIERHGIETMDDFNSIVQATGETFSNAGMDANGFVSDITKVNDTIGEFENAREELFFGSRANMTGDLIRQVNQQGVETLVTNTEVIMTNVFNGLTIPEMADIVIEEIEGRGRLNGFNITSS